MGVLCFPFFSIKNQLHDEQLFNYESGGTSSLFQIAFAYKFSLFFNIKKDIYRDRQWWMKKAMRRNGNCRWHSSGSRQRGRHLQSRLKRNSQCARFLGSENHWNTSTIASPQKIKKNFKWKKRERDGQKPIREENSRTSTGMSLILDPTP